jgi:hypothetical protein
MKKLFLFTFLLSNAIFAFAQDPNRPGRNLSDEENQLIQAYRQNPEPFRRVLRGEEENRARMQQEHRDQEHREREREREHTRPMGPRDIIDVTIEGGSVVFYGKNYAYDPVSFRISREEEMEGVFRRQRSSIETHVVVSYRSDGLHFDVPDQRPGTNGRERGYWVVGEDENWKGGNPIDQPEKINGSRSRSKADHLTMRIRYASARP